MAGREVSSCASSSSSDIEQAASSSARCSAPQASKRPCPVHRRSNRASPVEEPTTKVVEKPPSALSSIEAALQGLRLSLRETGADQEMIRGKFETVRQLIENADKTHSREIQIHRNTLMELQLELWKMSTQLHGITTKLNRKRASRKKRKRVWDRLRQEEAQEESGDSGVRQKRKRTAFW